MPTALRPTNADIIKLSVASTSTPPTLCRLIANVFFAIVLHIFLSGIVLVFSDKKGNIFVALFDIRILTPTFTHIWDTR